MIRRTAKGAAKALGDAPRRGADGLGPRAALAARNTVMATAMAALLAACGGDSPASGGGRAVIAPTPTPAPSPAPAPAPSPTPTPGIAFDPGGANIAGMSIPGQLEAVTICSDGAARFDGQGKVNGVGPTSRLFRADLAIEVDASFVYSYDINGFGGPTFGSATRKGGTAFEVFVIGPGTDSELQISRTRTLEFATLGFTQFYQPCYFAAAPPATVARPQTGSRSYDGLIDGLHQASGDADRLYGGSATLTFQPASGAYSVSLTLRTIEDAFGEPDGQAQSLVGSAGAVLRLDPATGTFASAALTGPDGFTGSITGRLGGSFHAAALLTFELSNAAGDRIWGVIAADGAQI